MSTKELSYSLYSEFDKLIIKKASALGLPLIGGTALEVLASYYKQKGVRKRSENDIDFTTDSKSRAEEFRMWIKTNVDPDKAQVDLYFVASHQIPSELILNANGILVMAPEYLIWAKLIRFLDRDIDDIGWLLNLTTAEKLEQHLSELGITDEELEKLNAIISNK